MTGALRNLFYRLLAEKQFLWSLIIRVGSAALLVVSSVVLARALGIEAFGTYSFALAVVAILQLPATAGAYTLVLRETSAAIGRSDFAVVKGLWMWSSRFVGKLSAGVLVVSLLAMLMLDFVWDRKSMEALLIALLTVPVIAFMALFSARLRGLGMVVLSQVPEQLLKPATFLVLVVFSAMLFGQLSANVAISLYLATAIVGLLLLFLIFSRVKPPVIDESAVDLSRVRSWRHALVPLTMLSGLQIVNAQAALVFLGIVGDAEAVAEIKLATALAVFGTFAAQVATFVLGPDFARAKSTSDVSHLKSLARRTVGLSTVTSIPILILLAAFASPILRTAYGDEYNGASAALVILSCAYMLMILLGACSMILTMTGNERIAVFGHVVGVFVNLALLFIFAPALGSIGAAVAIAAGMLVSQVFLLAAVIRTTRLDPSILGLLRYMVSKGTEVG